MYTTFTDKKLASADASAHPKSLTEVLHACVHSLLSAELRDDQCHLKCTFRNRMDVTAISMSEQDERLRFEHGVAFRHFIDPLCSIRVF